MTLSSTDIADLKAKAEAAGYHYVFNPNGSSTHICNIKTGQLGCGRKLPDWWHEGNLPMLTCTGCMNYCEKHNIPYGARSKPKR